MFQGNYNYKHIINMSNLKADHVEKKFSMTVIIYFVVMT